VVSVRLPNKHSIGAKFFGAFLAIGVIMGTIGAVGLYALSNASRIVVDIYDGQLAAINAVHSASIAFSAMETDVLRLKTSPRDSRVGIEADLAEHAPTLSHELDIATSRAQENDERIVIEDIGRLLQQWNALRQSLGEDAAADDAGFDSLSRRIVDRFDVLNELVAYHSAADRDVAVGSITRLQYVCVVVTVAGLLLSLVIALLLARRIRRPLAAAANAAGLIASGELDAPIPQGAPDEIGTLLRSMAGVQARFREMVEHEAEQRQSPHSMFIDAIEYCREGLVLVDAEGRVVVANSQLSRFFPSVAPFVVAGADFSAAMALMRLQLSRPRELDEPPRAGTGLRAYEGSLLDGEFGLADGRWIRVSRSETRDGGFLLFFSDFTEIKEREEHYKAAQLEAEAASGAKSVFLANMSHELRTPLNAIIGFSEIMVGQLFGVIGNQRYLEYSELILKSGRHLLDIIANVLDLAKSEAGKLDLRAEQVDLRDVVDECVDMLREQLTRAHHDLVIDMSPYPMRVMGEPSKLRQIVLNLLSNAIKFSEPGGTITIFAAPGEGGVVELAIADTGIGMSPSEIPIALAPFGQVESGLARRFEGTGLGLPLTKALVELHGGSMTIASVRGMGTTVTVVLPQFRAGGALAQA